MTWVFIGWENSLCQHDLERVHRGLLLMHIANVHQQVREEDSIHHLIHVIWVRPDQYSGILSAVCKWMEGVRHPWLDLMLPVFRRKDPRGYRIPLDAYYLALEDLKGLGLIEVKVKRR